MKLLLSLMLIALSATSHAAYEPFKMSCLVNPNERDSANLRSISFIVEPEFADNQYIAIKGVNKKETGTFDDTFIYSYNELGESAKFAVDQIMKKSKINVRDVFSITEFVMNPNGFFGYKISSEKGELGKGLYVLGTVVHCK